MPFLPHVVIETMASVVWANASIKGVKMPTYEYKLALCTNDAIFFSSKSNFFTVSIKGLLAKFSRMSGLTR